jgi:hypothetical protein
MQSRGLAMAADPNLPASPPRAGHFTILPDESLAYGICAHFAISTGPWAGAVYTLAPNKPNCPRVWPENAGWAEKQSQSKPIGRPDRCERADVIICAKQSQFPETENIANISNENGLPEIWPVPGREKQTQISRADALVPRFCCGFFGDFAGALSKARASIARNTMIA